VEKREKRCETCRWWDAHSTDLLKGDCRAPEDHRYWRVPITDENNRVKSYAMMDSFGREETRPDFGCGRWECGYPDDDLAANFSM
jgi:hypothetical protein